MQKYYEINDTEAVNKIDAALSASNKFDEKLHLVGEQYGADGYGVHNTLSNGKIFHHIWFFDESKIDKTLFKISKGKPMSGKPIFEARPRKTNKQFYSEFMKDMNNLNYSDLTTTLFGEVIRYGADLAFQKKGNIHHTDERIKRSRFVIFAHNLRNIQMKWVIGCFVPNL